MKRCTKCGQVKALSEFSKNRDGASGPILHSSCKMCRSAAAAKWFSENPERTLANKMRFELRSRYGLTVNEYDELLARQDGGCAICCSPTAGAGFKRLTVDHDHASGEVRGLLCNRCNRALGLLGDDLDLLRKAIKYLEGCE